MFTHAKAGVDYSLNSREAIQKVVYEASRGSAHFANEQRKESAVAARISRLRWVGGITARMRMAQTAL